MLGLSISLCIQKIAKGEVDLGDVKLIIGGSCCRTPEDWQLLISQYNKSYWVGIEDLAVGILTILIRDGRIYQPRVHGEPAPNISKGIWVEDELSLSKFRKCSECSNLLERALICSIERESDRYPEDYRQPLVPTIDPDSTPYRLGCFYFEHR